MPPADQPALRLFTLQPPQPCLQVGITLTEASVVVFAELYWNPGLLIQVGGEGQGVGAGSESMHCAGARPCAAPFYCCSVWSSVAWLARSPVQPC